MRRIWIFLTKGRRKLTTTLYFVIDKNILTIIMLSFHYPLALVEAAEGVTVSTMVSGGWTNICRCRIETIGVSVRISGL